MGTSKARSIYISDELWARIQAEAGLETAQEGRRVSVSELIRRVMAEEVERRQEERASD